jgi:uncharacterized membrane protein
MDYAISAITLVTIDSIYITLVGDWFKNSISKIQKSPFKLNYLGAILSYIFLLFLLYKFIIHPKKPVTDAVLLGMGIYAVFDFTNLAIFNNYPFFLSILDIVWGGLLFGLTTFITYLFTGTKI